VARTRHSRDNDVQSIVGKLCKTTLPFLKKAKVDINKADKKFLPSIHFFVERKLLIG
jgi:hypothetical protein